jgi:DNA invertase Pin-like site-specific DNA recombinase
MLIGYARVSTHDQTLNLQQDALEKAGCTKIFTDTASGAKTERKGLDQALTYVRKGDTLVVWRLDRLGRSLPHLITTMTDLEERGIGFKSLTENIDTTTSGGKLIFHIFGALAEFERNLIRERTQAGLTAAKARGKKGGRPQALTARQLGIAQDLYEKRYPNRRNTPDPQDLQSHAVPRHQDWGKTPTILRIVSRSLLSVHQCPSPSSP